MQLPHLSPQAVQADRAAYTGAHVVTGRVLSAEAQLCPCVLNAAGQLFAPMCTFQSLCVPSCSHSEKAWPPSRPGFYDQMLGPIMSFHAQVGSVG